MEERGLKLPCRCEDKALSVIGFEQDHKKLEILNLQCLSSIYSTRKSIVLRRLPSRLDFTGRFSL